MNSSKYDLISLTNLIETEEHFENKAISLAEEIKKTNIWTVPIAVEINTNGIMMVIIDLMQPILELGGCHVFCPT